MTITNYTIFYQYRKGAKKDYIFFAHTSAENVKDALNETSLTNEKEYDIHGVFDDASNLFRRVENKPISNPYLKGKKMNMQDIRNDIDNELNGTEYAIHGSLVEVSYKVALTIGKINDKNEREDIKKEDVVRLGQLLKSIPGIKFTRRMECCNAIKLNSDCNGEILACFTMNDKDKDLIVKFYGENCPNRYGLEIVSEGRLHWHKVEMPVEVCTEVMGSGERTITIHQSGVPLDKAYFVIVYENLNEKLLSYSFNCDFDDETQAINDTIECIEKEIDEKL